MVLINLFNNNLFLNFQTFKKKKIILIFNNLHIIRNYLNNFL